MSVRGPARSPLGLFLAQSRRAPPNRCRAPEVGDGERRAESTLHAAAADFGAGARPRTPEVLRHAERPSRRSSCGVSRAYTLSPPITLDRSCAFGLASVRGLDSLPYAARDGLPAAGSARHETLYLSGQASPGRLAPGNCAPGPGTIGSQRADVEHRGRVRLSRDRWRRPEPPRDWLGAEDGPSDRKFDGGVRRLYGYSRIAGGEPGRGPGSSM